MASRVDVRTKTSSPEEPCQRSQTDTSILQGTWFNHVESFFEELSWVLISANLSHTHNHNLTVLGLRVTVRTKPRGPPSRPCSATSLNLGRILLTRRHAKLKGPQGLSQKVRDARFIHNQASLGPTIRERGIIFAGANRIFHNISSFFLLPDNVLCKSNTPGEMAHFPCRL